ncbi:solute carrier family 23 member 1 [Elysia marginata]|uniref:Solute carrier family 23 member 1 n=1 Tax=Elysia marginata TaxID=1093978 RepID=A0AAV4FXZ1_9GAST|nr:solute carrier family 23 member 1 [Elysia marginata]
MAHPIGEKKDGSQNSMELTSLQEEATEIHMTNAHMEERNGKVAKESSPDQDILYGVTDNPPWPLTILLGFQHYLTSFGSTLSVPLVLAGPLCMAGDKVAVGELIATTFFMSGISTLLQASIGIRLPIIQGATFSFLAPTAAILNLPRWTCSQNTSTELFGLNETENLLYNQSLSEVQEDSNWQTRMRELQGAICVASLFQILLGVSGLMAFILRYIGPLTITPTITLIGLSLFEVAAAKAATQWWIAATTLVLIALFCQYLKSVNIPLPVCSSGKQCSTVKLPIFKLFPILLAMLLSWLLCFILTVTDSLPSTPGSWGYLARTDVRASVLQDSRWIRIPYPGQWGLPTVSVGAVFGMLAGVLASIMESIGDYYACARLSGAPPPPVSAVNRGIAVEGIGCLLTGLFGTGNGTTSYSENVGAIGITKVGSRRVVMAAGVLLILMGCVGKVGALFVTIPDPVVGGMFIAMFGMITAVGLSNLQFVDLKSSRNLFILAFSIFIGLCLPNWLAKNKDVINTGNQTMDQMLTVLCSTSMFIGGLIGFLLDLTLPGTLEERGIIKWKMDGTEQMTGSDSETMKTASTYSNDYHDPIYDLPRIFRCIYKPTWCKYVPIFKKNSYTLD